MKLPEPAVSLDQHQMDVLDRVASKAGCTGEELVRRTLKRVMDSLEGTQKTGESIPEFLASNFQVVSGAAPPNNVIRLPLKR